MLKSYFKIAWRHLLKNRFYSALNIIGLSTGIAFTMLIAAYIWSQWEVNRHLKNLDRQYIITSEWKNPNQGFPLATLGPLAKELRDQHPDLVANFYRYDGITSNVSKGEKVFRQNLQVGDSTMLGMYGFKLLQGNVTSALNEPFTTVITKENAIKFFGKTDVVGETVTIENFSGSKHNFKITGVLRPVPKNSVTALIDAAPGDFYVSASNLDFFGRNMAWQNPYIVNYLELQEGVKPKDLDKSIAYLLKQNAPPAIAADMKPVLVPLKSLYLTANNHLVEKMIYALSGIALLILAMAVINFINISVGYSGSRMREIGIRKVVGGLKKQLIIQFLMESTVIVFLATLVSILLYVLTRSWFSQIVGSPLPALGNFPAYFIMFPLVLVFSLGLVAGIYPAFILSSINSIESLKGKFTALKDNLLFRKSLIGFQFVTATIAFVGAIIISQQIDLFLGKNLGYNKEYIVSAQVPRDWTKKGVLHMENIRDQFAVLPEVSDVSLSYEIPDGNNVGYASIFPFGSDSTQSVSANVLISDNKYLDVYKIPLLAGSFFYGHQQDSGKVVLNETALKALGWRDPQAAIGQQLRLPNDPTVFSIKGVVKDFHFGSMQQKIPPIIFFNVEFANPFRYLSFKLKPGSIVSGMDALQKKWHALIPGAAFEYKFMDDTLDKVYTSEFQLKRASYTATLLAVIIVLLGVVGLIALSVQRRVKEIGIRKVLGASIPGIISLFLKEFLSVIAVGVIVACPLSYWIMHRWLENYAYRIDITAYPFLLSVLSLAGVTALVICGQSVKAAIINPVKALRTE